MKRITFLKTVMAAALCLPLNIQAATPVRQARKAAAPQKDICLQLYSVRDLLKDVKYYTFGDNRTERTAGEYWEKVKKAAQK